MSNSTKSRNDLYAEAQQAIQAYVDTFDPAPDQPEAFGELLDDIVNEAMSLLATETKTFEHRLTEVEL